MSRPDVFNAFDEVMITDLEAAFSRLAQDSKGREGFSAFLAKPPASWISTE